MKAESRSSDFVGAFSNRASDDPADGHYFWTYSAIHENQSMRGLNVPTVIGPQKSSVNFIEPFLKRTLYRNEFRVNPFLPFSYKLLRLSQLVARRREEGIQRYFHYDGGLSDYLIISLLALRNPRVHFTFNFHWADQWMLFAKSKKISAILTRGLMRRTIRDAPDNLRFSAETRPFAEELRLVFGHEFSVFPIFSSNNPQRVRAWNRRNIDVLFLPQRRSEMDFVARASRALGEKGVAVLTALRRDTWTRWTNRPNHDARDSPLFLPLGAKEYEELLMSTRVVVLPYDKPYFRWGSSGKFNEAIAHGCFPVVPEGTAIATQSSGEPDRHVFTYPDEESLVGLVSRVLASKPAEALTPVLVTDFLEWMSIPNIPETRKLSLSNALAHVFLLFAASFYRDRRLIERFRSLIEVVHRKISGQ